MPAARSRIYLDHAASTPVSPGVLRAMKPYFSMVFGNPGSLHAFGQEAIAAVDRSREAIAGALGVGFREIVFTGSATEANNLALRGAIRRWRTGKDASPRLLVSAVEHESVLVTADDLVRSAMAEALRIPVDKEGVVKVEALKKMLDARTAVVSVMYVNNETGAVQPIAKIAEAIREFRGRNPWPLFHVDAVQALQFLDCRPEVLGADLVTFSAHKIYGPKGVGALYVRGGEPGTVLLPLVTGGGQEFGLRSGTENVPLIAGMARAMQEIGQDKEKHARRVAALKKEAWRGIKRIFPRAQLNGPADAARSLPNTMNVWLPGKKAEDALIRLDMAGIAVSAGSACTARSSQPSYVLRAMGLPEKRIKESIRMSLGRGTTAAEMRRLLAALKNI